MPNDFEKQVRNKMEELDLAPGETVWTKVNAQIHQRKDRRRVIFWLPVFLIIFTGGWWLYKSTSSPTGSRKTEKELTTTGNNHIGEMNDKLKSGTSLSTSSRSTGNNLSAIKPTLPKPAEDSGHFAQASIPSELIINGRFRESAVHQNHARRKRLVFASSSISKAVKPIRKNLKSVRPVQTPFEQQTVFEISKKHIRENSSIISYQLPLTVILMPVLHPEPYVVTTPFEKSSSKTADRSRHKWNFGIQVEAGAGTLRLQNQSSSAASSSSVPGLSPGYGSNVQPYGSGLSYSAALVFSRRISPRVQVKTGIGYTYFRTTQVVGQQIQKDTAVRTATSNNVSVSSYYQSASVSTTNSVPANNNSSIIYINNYQLISIPLCVQLQILHTLPLNLEAGFDLDRLIGTNALAYNGQVYFQDKNSFTRDLVFACFGLNYTFFRNQHHPLQLGPQIQYGLSSLNKVAPSAHFWQAGFSATILAH